MNGRMPDGFYFARKKFSKNRSVTIDKSERYLYYIE